ncbi:hypothetical protein EDC02_6040 [Micromonospora sp. Llam0]|uniref:hypothetical protein n=1 Tax=Micromonospora sp. Llam0 TaxID=2485143 RepID=UPI000FA814F3|nr:hypothetical protein [Micromonospora sp. Llam0]ROO51172.1 hypothetical protein EDC02_6040 [Micromonospora sp. Llam0]
MNQRTTKHWDELLARMVIESALDIQVEVHDDGSEPSMHDLTLKYPDGRVAAAEVVSTRDPKARRLSAAVADLGYQRCANLRRLWIISVTPSAKVGRLAKVAPSFLADLERAGVDRLPRTSTADPRLPDLRALGVASCTSTAPTEKHPPGFYINPAAVAAFAGDGDGALRKAEALLLEVTDVVAKLQLSGTAERHAVIMITHDWLGPHTALEGDAVPNTPPELPDGIDCLWLVVQLPPPTRAVYWLGDGQWRDVIVSEEQATTLLAPTSHINSGNPTTRSDKIVSQVDGQSTE